MLYGKQIKLKDKKREKKKKKEVFYLKKRKVNFFEFLIKHFVLFYLKANVGRK